MSDILRAICEDYEERTGERNYELDRMAKHHRSEEDPDEILDYIRQMGF